MGLNFLLLVVGLVICFGGIYIRKVCSAALGLIWGSICSFVVIFMTVGLWGLDDETTAIIIMCAVLCAIISVINDKLCAVINAFLSSFFLVATLLQMADRMESATLITIATAIALIISIITVKIYDYSFIIITAFSGAFIASVGGCGIVHDEDASDVLLALMFGDEVTGFILIGTMILGILGCIVQWRRLKGRAANGANANGENTSDSSTPVQKVRIQNPFVREIKENWGLLLAPIVVTLLWKLWGSQLLWILFPSMYDYDFIPQTLWNYMPSIITAILSGWKMATFVVAIKTRSKNFCILWMLPNMIIALAYLVQMFRLLMTYGEVVWVFDLGYAIACFVPFLSWWIIRKLEKAFAPFSRSDVKAYVLCGICAFLVLRLADKIIFFIESKLIAFGPEYMPIWVSCALLVLSIIAMAIIIQVIFNTRVKNLYTSALNYEEDAPY